MKTSKCWRTRAVVLALFCAAQWTLADAAVSAFFSTGTGCGGQPASGFSPGGTPVKVSLCANTTIEKLCGHTFNFHATNASSSGAFKVTKWTVGTTFPEKNIEIALPSSITFPPSRADFGSITLQSTLPAANQLLATFELTPQANATAAAYTISLTANSILSLSADGTCANVSEIPIAATLTLTRQ